MSSSPQFLNLHRAWIALGSNIRPQHYLPWAVRELSCLGTVTRVSHVWQSSPVGDVNQDDFCNAAALLQTRAAPLDLRRELRKIEERLGRRRDPQNKNAPRTIDLDLSLFDELVLETPELTLPDPDLFHRPFLAIPLAELTPDFPHPLNGQTLRAIAAATTEIAPLKRRDDIILPLPVSS